MANSVEDEIKNLKKKVKALEQQVAKLQSAVDKCKSKPTKGNVRKRGPKHGLVPLAR